MKSFSSVSTAAARFQDISLNPQKLAGMCAKLKCCLNYEVDDYMEHGRQLPSREVVLQTQDADYFYFKADILAGLVTYSTDRRTAANLETITAQRAKEIIDLNRRGEKPAELQPDDKPKQKDAPVDLLAGDSITRFDKAKKKKKKKKTQTRANEQPAKDGHANGAPAKDGQTSGAPAMSRARDSHAPRGASGVTANDDEGGK